MVIMCCEIIGEDRERRNPGQQSQPSNKHTPVMGSPKPKGSVVKIFPTFCPLYEFKLSHKALVSASKYGVTFAPCPP